MLSALDATRGQFGGNFPTLRSSHQLERRDRAYTKTVFQYGLTNTPYYLELCPQRDLSQNSQCICGIELYSKMWAKLESSSRHLAEPDLKALFSTDPEGGTEVGRFLKTMDRLSGDIEDALANSASAL